MFVVNAGDLHHRYGTSDSEVDDDRGGAGDQRGDDEDVDDLVEHVRHVEAVHAAKTAEAESDGEGVA